MTDFEDGPFATLEDFFLRRLREGSRPLGTGVVSPVDGKLIAGGVLAPDTTLPIKGRDLSLDVVVNGQRPADHALASILGKYRSGGQAAVIFLSPRGYHRVHMPVDGTIETARWIPGRYFPQNEHALQHIARVHERNERLVMHCRGDGGDSLVLVMVGASAIGGIILKDVPRATWTRATPVALNLRRRQGEEIGHFTFGSTVVLAVERGGGTMQASVGHDVKMGQTLFGPTP